MNEQKTSPWEYTYRSTVHHFVEMGGPARMIRLLEATNSIISIELLELKDEPKVAYLEVRAHVFDGTATVRFAFAREGLNVDKKRRLMRALRAILPDGSGPQYAVRLGIAKKLDTVPYI